MPEEHRSRGRALQESERRQLCGRRQQPASSDSEASIVSTWSTAADDQSPAIHGLRRSGLRGPRRCRSR